MSSSDQTTLRSERERTHGNVHVNMATTALQWTGLLRKYYNDSHLPELEPHMVALMFAASKANRAATPGAEAYNEDDYVDGAAYFDIANETDRRRP